MSAKPLHAKMSPQDRAKQFLPFAALKGYEEALRAKELEAEARSEQKTEPIFEDFTSEPSDIP